MVECTRFDENIFKLTHSTIVITIKEIVIMKDYKCIYCGREIKNAGSLAVHQKECMFNPDRVIIPRKSNWNKRKKPWNAGHKY